MEISDTIKCNCICITEVPEGEEREKRAEGLSEEIIAESFLYMGKEIDIQIMEAQRATNKINKRGLHQDT